MSQADLEISVFHRSAADYGVTLRFRHPAAGQDKSASGSLALDEAALGQRQHDASAYGELLAAQIFAGEDVRGFLDQALAVAASQQTPLHLRLFIHPDAAALHALRWETLRLPGRAAPLAVGDEMRFSRYLDSADWRPAHTAERDALAALVAVASPDVRGTTLAEVRTDDELKAARAGLGDIPCETLAGRGQVTLNALLARLRDGCDILYLVAHGMLVNGEPHILLEREDGGRAWTSGRELVARLRELAQPPSLVVLASCQSAGTGKAPSAGQDGGALAGLGPRLAAAGVPAVVAMQGNVSMATTAAFMPVFLRELRRDGVVDRAMAVARGAVRERPDWWMPVLYSRLKDGRVFDLAAMLPPPTCPYPGMVPFRAGDARFFYGREDEVQQMMDHLRHQRLLLVIGPSGSGKSSLIAAGLLPRLEKSTYFAPDFWLVRTMRPLDHPVTALAACLEGDVSQPEQAVAALLAAHAPAQRLLLVIDQFEETFSLADKAERQQFMAALQTLRRNQQCALVIALRADFYPDLMNCELWPVDPGQRLEVAVLRGGALRQAIRQPATDVEVEIDEALIERLLADAAGEPGALPMLQETLVLLWERMRRRQITLGDYEQLGEGERSGLAVAVARKADATVAELTLAEQLIAQRIFLRLIQFGEGRRDTRRQLPAADLRSAAEDDQAFERTLEHLARNRLLTTSGEEGRARRVDIAHEALITGWPRLQEWLNQRRAAEQTRRRLEAKAAEWVRAARRGGLLDEYELQEAESWLAGEDAQELGYSQELAGLAAASKDALVQAKAKDVAAARNRQRSRLFAGGLVLALLVIALVGYFAWTAQTQRVKAETAATAEAAAGATSDANAQLANTQKVVAETAQAQAVAAQATAQAAATGEAVQRAKADAARVALSAVDQLAIDKERALLLAIHAAKKDISAFTDSALRRVLASPGHTAWFWPDLTAVPVWSHSGRELLILTPEDGIVILDTDTGTKRVVATDHHSPVKRLVWSPDDAYLLVETSAGVQVWSTAVQQLVAEQAQVALTQVPWSPDGSKVLMRTDQGLSLWDWNDDQIITLDAGEWPEIAWSGDSSYLSTYSDGTLQIWDANDGAPRSLAPELAQVGGALWNPKDSRLLIIGPDGRLRIWNADDVITIELATSIEPLPTPDPNPPIIVDGAAVNPDPVGWRNYVTWSPDGTHVLTFKDRAQVWNADDGSKLADLTDMPGGGGEFHSLAAHWSPDGQRVLIADRKQVSIFYLDGSGIILKLSSQRSANVHPFYGVSQPWSPDGTKILTQEHNKLTVWDAMTGAQIAFLTSDADIDIAHAEWSPTGEYVLGKDDLADEIGNVRVWGLNPALKPVRLEGYFQSWSPDGAYLITTSDRAERQVARVWNADTGLEIAVLEAQGQSKQIDTGSFWGFPIDEWSPDGQRLITYSSHDVLRVWNATDWQTHVDLDGHRGQITDAAWSPPARDLVATASEDGTVRIWNPSTGQMIRVLEGHEGPVNDVDWSPDGTYIASAGTDKTVRIWWADSGEPVQVLRGHSGSVTGVSWNPQVGSPLLLSERDFFGDKNDTARVWNILTGEQVVALVFDGSNVHTATWNNKLGTHIAAITDKHKVYLWQQAGWSALPDAIGKSIAWSPDGAYLAGARADATIVVWDSRTGSVVKEFLGHTGDVNSIDWSLADAKSFVSHGDDGQIRLWNRDFATATAVIDTGDTSSSRVTFSPSGTLIAFMGSNEGLQVYPTRLEDLIAAACRVTVRNLGPVDWQEFIGPEEPKVICPNKLIPGTDYPDKPVNTGLG